MTARTRNVLISGIATVAIALALATASSEASAMTFGGLGHGVGGGMPAMNHAAPVMNHVGPSLPTASHVGPALPAFNHVGPALPAVNHGGLTIPMEHRVNPSLPMANHTASVIHALPTTNVPHTTTSTRDVRPTPISNARTDGPNRPAVTQTDRRVETNHGGVQPNASTVGTATSVKPGTVVRPNLTKDDHNGDVAIVRTDLKPNARIVNVDGPRVVGDDREPQAETQWFRFRDLLGGAREVIIDLSDNTSVHVWCRNDGQIGIACHDWNHGLVWLYVEDKDGNVNLIPPKKAKKPAKPSFISLYDPETGKTVTRTWNDNGTHTDTVEEGNTLDKH